MSLQNLKIELEKFIEKSLLDVMSDTRYIKDGGSIMEPMSFMIEHLFQTAIETHKVYITQLTLSIKERVKVSIEISNIKPENYSYQNISYFLYQFMLSLTVFNLLFEEITISYDKPFQVSLIQRLEHKFAAFNLKTDNLREADENDLLPKNI